MRPATTSSAAECAITEILPLYARLSTAEQRRVFHPGPQRRIILSTNVAETSLTVPRIRFVIDTGYARISRYAHRSRIQRLPIESVSQASANQRLGRCGRLGPGVCVRLYSEEDFDLRPEFTEPEILRTSLASVILRMLAMGLGVVEEFPFLDAPAPRMINDAYHLLFELRAVDGNRELLESGRKLARWPLDVRLARMVLEGDRQACLEDMLVLASFLSIQDPRERPLDAQAAADEAHASFEDEKSDFAARLKLWAWLRKQRKEKNRQPVSEIVRQAVSEVAKGAGVVRSVSAIARPGSRRGPGATRKDRKLRKCPQGVAERLVKPCGTETSRAALLHWRAQPALPHISRVWPVWPLSKMADGR